MEISEIHKISCRATGDLTNRISIFQKLVNSIQQLDMPIIPRVLKWYWDRNHMIVHSIKLGQPEIYSAIKRYIF